VKKNKKIYYIKAIIYAYISGECICTYFYLIHINILQLLIFILEIYCLNSFRMSGLTIYSGPRLMPSVRFLVAIMCFLATLIQYTQRINMSVAIVCMVSFNCLQYLAKILFTFKYYLFLSGQSHSSRHFEK